MSVTVQRRRVLVDDEHEARLRADGVVVVPVLSPDEVDDLLERRGRAAASATADPGLHIDFIDVDRAAMASTTELLGPVWERHLPRLFVDHSPVITTFITKRPGDRSRMLLHREPTYVDGCEEVFNLWMPLVDTTRERDNGLLRLVPGSERLPMGLMGFNTPVHFRPFEAALEAMSVAVEVPAGFGLIYPSSMLHWSEDNRSDLERPAVATAIAPRSATRIHVVATGRGGRRIHAVDDDFFVSTHPEDAPERLDARYPVLREVHDDVRLTAEVVARTLGLDEPPVEHTVLPGKPLSGDPVSDSPQLPVSRVVASWTSGPDLELPSLVESEPPVRRLEVIGGVGSLMAVRSAPRLDRLSPASTLVRPAGADLLVLAPRSRAQLDGTSEGDVIVVVEAPRVNAGASTPAGVATLEPGVVAPLGEAAPTEVWNEGPGPLIAVVGRPRRWRRVGRRVG